MYGTSQGTSTDGNGNSLAHGNRINRIVVKHISYATDTLTITDFNKPIKIILSGGKMLSGVEVRSDEGYLVSIKPISTKSSPAMD